MIHAPASILATAAIALALLAPPATAAPGDLDPAFGDGGVVLEGTANGLDQALGVVVQGDGRIVAVGYASGVTGTRASVVRYLADGTLDAGFGAGGILRVDWGSRISRAHAIALQPDGRLVVGGFTGDGSGSSFALLRLNADGSLDTAFGTGGRVVTAFPGGASGILGLAIQADGRIVAIGYAASGGAPSSIAFAMARYLANGTLDATFGTAGLVVDDVTTSSDFAYRAALQADGRIVVAGSVTYAGTSTDFTLARYLATGALDTSFGTAGRVTLAPTAASESGYDVLVQPDGKIVAAGNTLSASGGLDALVVRLSATGAPDTTFNGTGSRAIAFPAGISIAVASARALARLADGRIVVAALDISNGVAGVVRLNADGTLDGSFGGGGPSFLRSGAIGFHIGLALDGAGRAVLAHAESASPFDNTDFALARFRSDGTLDPTFGAGGRLLTDTSPGTGGIWNAVVRQGDGKIVVAGKVLNSAGEFFAVARLHAHGAWDETFGEGGFAIVPGTGAQGYGQAFALALLADGRIVAAGALQTASGVRGAVVRLQRDGALDTSFDTDGRAELDMGSPEIQDLRAVAIYPDERILVAGNAFDTQFRMVAARFLTDGRLDGGFGTPTYTTGTGYDQALGVTLQPDGKAVLAGRNVVDGYLGPTLLRITHAGNLDATFGTGGVVTDATRSAQAGEHLAVAVQPDGRIVAAGTAPTGQARLVRVNANGTPDAGFGTAGEVSGTMGGALSIGYALAIQPDGRILLAGMVLVSPSWNAFVARYGANGALDTTFAGTGYRIVDIAQSYDGAFGIAVQPDGKAVVAGVGVDSAMVFRLLLEQTPDAFAFASQDGVPLSTMVTSNAPTITGITGLVPVAVSGGAYSVGCTASFTSQPGFVAANVPVCVRHVSAGAPATAITTTLVIGTRVAAFTSVTGKASAGYSLVASANPTVAGASVTFTATVTGAFGTPTGLVTFRDGGTVLGAASLGPSGQAQLATSALYAGARSITAAYSGDALYSAGTSPALPHTVTAVVVPPPTRGDANGDRKADLVWRDATGGLALWTMDGPNIVSTFFGIVGSEWQVHAVGDANGDGKSDLFWWNASLGSGYIWFLDGAGVGGFASLGILGAEWSLVGAGDFNGDGRADALFRRSTDGLYYTFLLDGGTITAQGSLGALAAAWSLAGIGDTDGDGKADLVFRNGDDGSVLLWKMNGTAAPVATVVGQVDAGFWRIAGVGDFDGNGRADLLWQGDDGSLWVWMMNGAAVTSASSIGVLPGPGWTVRMVADFTGDAKADIVWRFVDGTTYLWIMNGSAIVSTPQIANPGGSWQIAP